jgi:MOSC domain-containing protein YiiM
MVTATTKEELTAGLDWVKKSPKTDGRLEMIVCRTGINERLVLETGELSRDEGLIGDNWHARGSNRMPDGSAHPEMQIAIMNARAIQMLAQVRDQWPLAGDQLFIDIDLGSLEPGQLLRIGSAVLEITSLPHTGCAKFSERFGQEAIRWVNSREGRELRLRGIYARVIKPGSIKVRDLVQVFQPNPNEIVLAAAGKEAS